MLVAGVAEVIVADLHRIHLGQVVLVGAVMAAVVVAMLQQPERLIGAAVEAVVVITLVLILEHVQVQQAAPVSSLSNTVYLPYLFMYSVEQLLGLRLQVQPRWITW